MTSFPTYDQMMTRQRVYFEGKMQYLSEMSTIDLQAYRTGDPNHIYILIELLHRTSDPTFQTFPIWPQLEDALDRHGLVFDTKSGEIHGLREVRADGYDWDEENKTIIAVGRGFASAERESGGLFERSLKLKEIGVEVSSPSSEEEESRPDSPGVQRGFGGLWNILKYGSAETYAQFKHIIVQNNVSATPDDDTARNISEREATKGIIKGDAIQIATRSHSARTPRNQTVQTEGPKCSKLPIQHFPPQVSEVNDGTISDSARSSFLFQQLTANGIRTALNESYSDSFEDEEERPRSFATALSTASSEIPHVHSPALDVLTSLRESDVDIEGGQVETEYMTEYASSFVFSQEGDRISYSNSAHADGASNEGDDTPATSPDTSLETTLDDLARHYTLKNTTLATAVENSARAIRESAEKEEERNGFDVEEGKQKEGIKEPKKIRMLKALKSISKKVLKKS